MPRCCAPEIWSQRQWETIFCCQFGQVLVHKSCGALSSGSLPPSPPPPPPHAAPSRCVGLRPCPASCSGAQVSQIANVTLDHVADTCLAFSWEVAAQCTQFLVSVSQFHTGTDNLGTVTIQCSEPQCRLTRLSPATLYNISITTNDVQSVAFYFSCLTAPQKPKLPLIKRNRLSVEFALPPTLVPDQGMCPRAPAFPQSQGHSQGHKGSQTQG